MPNNISNVAFAQPTDPALELQDIARKRKLAEALQAQGTQPMGGTDVVGGWAIKKSPLEGLGKMAQALSGSYQQDQLNQREKTIAANARAQGNTDVHRFMEALNGAPAQAGSVSPADELGGGPAMPATDAVAPSKSKALEIALSSQSPIVQGAGSSIMADMLKSKEWKLGERYNAQTGKPEKFMYRTDDPTITQAMGGQQGVTADTQAKLDQAEKFRASLSAKDQKQLEIDAAKLGVSIQQLLINRSTAANTAAHTSFSSDGAVGVAPPQVSVPQIPQIPAAGVPLTSPQSPQQFGQSPLPAWAQGQPQVPPQAQRPPMQPQGVPVQSQAARQGSLTVPAAPRGATEQAIRRDAVLKKQDMEIKREFNMGGINDTIKQARDILNREPIAGADGKTTVPPKPTESWIGSGVDALGSVVGMAPAGAAKADRLRALGGALTSKVPRMEGPQSNNDVKLYEQMAGRVGDDTIPVKRRLEALAEVERLYGKYEHLNRGESGGIPGAPPINFQERRKAPSGVTLYDVNGNAIR